MSLKKPSTAMNNLPVRSSPRCNRAGKEAATHDDKAPGATKASFSSVFCELHESFRKASGGGERERSQLSVAANIDEIGRHTAET
jgi:hypothetical protein